MDIRIEKTDRAIEKAFMELRARQPLEKIRIKDLCTLAKVNKSTFYAHYEDIYELSSRLENKLIHVILDSVPNVGLTAAHTEQLTRELFHAFVQHQEAVNILSPGQGRESLPTALKRVCETVWRPRTPPLQRTPTGASCFPSACRAASMPLPTTAARWTWNIWSICWL